MREKIRSWVRVNGWHSRIGRRLALAFLAAAGIPLLLAFAGAALAVSAWWDDQTRATLQRSTREVGQNVLARLQEADELLVTWAPPGQGQATPPALPGLTRVFRSAWWLQADGEVPWGVGPRPSGMSQAWLAQLQRAASRRGTVLLRAGSDTARDRHRSILLQWREASSPPGREGPVTVWLARPHDSGWWLAQVDPEHLWRPLKEAGAGSRWRVSDARQQLLVDAQTDAVDLGSAQRDQWSLFLGGEFGADDWLIEQISPPQRLQLGGVPLVRWTLQFGAIVVLVVAGLSLTQIRRILRPLDALIGGTRRLMRREPAARVPVLGKDEFGELARSFNDMSAHIDAQIRSLEALGWIDRAIVDGQPLPAVLDQVLMQVLSRTGAATAAVAYLPDSLEGGPQTAHRVASERRVRIQWRSRSDAAAVPADRSRGSVPGLLTPADQGVWRQMEQEGPWPPADAQSMDWTARLPGASQLVWWGSPVAWGDDGRAVLLVGREQSPDGPHGRVANDLRDRLAVAMAAHQRERMLHWRAFHDDLTGLANRAGLNDELNRWLSSAHPPLPMSVMFVDLDHFKHVNDTQGHEMGDRLLQQAAERLTAVMPPLGLVARNGGDEFVVAVPHLDEGGAVEVARRICERLALPFSCGGREHQLGASIGIAVSPTHGHDRATLLRHADMAMYAAKQGGRGRYAVFAEALDQQSSERSRLLADLRRAVERDDELVLHYQPRVGTKDGRVRSVEALVRWQHPDLGLLGPGRFIPLAEESDLIEALGYRVLRMACVQMARWQVEGAGIDRVSVNVSPRQLASGRLCERVIGALMGQGLSPSMLELEVTESLLVGDAQSAISQLQSLREAGVMIALDDFGTGFSSLATLRQLPIDVMKIDRAFVKDLGRDDSALAVARTILTLARSLGMHTVAEGMETAEQTAVLQELGVDEMQGFWFSRPVPPDQLARLLQSGSALARRSGPMEKQEAAAVG